MKITNELFDEYTDHLDPTVYDLKAMKADYDNNNFLIESTLLDNYRMTSIVLESTLNGQWEQAKAQFKEYNLTANDLTGLISDKSILRIIS